MEPYSCLHKHFSQTQIIIKYFVCIFVSHVFLLHFFHSFLILILNNFFLFVIHNFPFTTHICSSCWQSWVQLTEFAKCACFISFICLICNWKKLLIENGVRNKKKMEKNFRLMQFFSVQPKCDKLKFVDRFNFAKFWKQ